MGLWSHLRLYGSSACRPSPEPWLTSGSTSLSKDAQVPSAMVMT